MPIYEYRCNQCGNEFSQFYRSVRAAEEDDALRCPTCASADVQRRISRIAVLGAEGDGGSVSEESSAPEPSPLFGRKELNERLRQERNRDSIARID